jgi:pimeloyl-ACP methyl ester carboxylesterase
MIQATTGSYASVNGLEMYYEVHGSGQPLVLLHGGMTTIGDFAALLPAFAQTRQVIASERQGHGHTADIDRPFTLEYMADDTAEVLRQLKIEKADILGYSTGGSVALAFAMRHPDMVRKLVLISAIYNDSGYYPGMLAGLKHATAADMPDIMRQMYAEVAPRPDDWPKLVAKSVASAGDFKGWQPEDIQAIKQPTLVIVADGDIVRTEHAVEMYRLLPQANLAVLPATDHITILFDRAEWVVSMTSTFLDAPMPEPE